MLDDSTTTPAKLLACKLLAMAADLRARAAAEDERARQRGLQAVRRALACAVDSLRGDAMDAEGLRLVLADLHFIARCLAEGDTARAALAVDDLRQHVAEVLAGHGEG